MNETQPNFDIKKYLGKWYEVGKYPNPWETDCPLSTAQYTWLPDVRKILVLNSCLDMDRKVIRESVGIARIPNPNDPSKLKVKFMDSFSEPKKLYESPYEGDYYVHWTDYDNFSIVGGPTGRFLWILSRQPRISAADAQFLLNKAKTFGYNIDKVLTNVTVVYK
jgi:apolipoprotein D and lipocalin family protein